MKILGVKPGHDGSITYLEDGRLVVSIDAEKDSFGRHHEIHAGLVEMALEIVPDPPDVVAIGGWYKHLPGYYTSFRAGYYGLENGSLRRSTLFGRPAHYFSSSHERSHLMMTALAPEAPLREAVVLIWEGTLGAWYHWQNYGASVRKTDVMSQPGGRYISLYALADARFPDTGGTPRTEDAGKVMALAGLDDGEELDSESRAVVDDLLRIENVYPFEKYKYDGTPLHNCGVEDPLFARAARYLTDRIYDVFHRALTASMPSGLPLVVAGGCGLNCDWNQRWEDSGYFSSVFVPPFADDSGSAIGTAIDAHVRLGGEPRVEWDVYRGLPFEHDCSFDERRWERGPVDHARVARALHAGDVVAWVHGSCELGPRALGHRSLLATPLRQDAKAKLNFIKRREAYRPVAPCVLEENQREFFDNARSDPYMLRFARVLNDAIPAVTHNDGTARLQTVGQDDSSRLRPILEAFRELTGVGVLCNTSLNFPGHGFINRTSELDAYCATRLIEHVVLDDVWYSLRRG